MTRSLLLPFSLFCALINGPLSYAYSLPSEPIKLEKVRPSSARTIYDRNGKVLDYWYGDRLRLYRPKSQIDSKLVELVVWAEDAKFWAHSGFDLEEIKNSLKKNIEKGEIKRGGSTITQQLAKNLFLDKEKTLVRKLFEIPWVVRLEKDLSKAQILELYLNVIEWGPGVYGAEAACRHFFDRSCENLEPHQAAYLAVIIPNPPRFDLFAHPGALRGVESRRKSLVNRLVDEKKIAPELAASYMADFSLVPPNHPERNFPLSHNATYFGNKAKKSVWLRDLEGLLGFKTKGDLRLSLDKSAFQNLPEVELVNAPGSKTRYLVKMENEKILCFIKIPAGKTPILEGLGEAWAELPSLGVSQLMLEPSSKNLR